MKCKISIVNAFCEAGRPGSGNPAAVCLLDSSLLPSMTDEVRQKMAADINLSETAYVEPVEPQSGQGLEVFKQLDRFKLRWFTPAIEVPLCGHATLASAAVLFQEAGSPAAALHFETLSGTLTVTRKTVDGRQLLQMSLPESPATDPLPQGLQSTAADAAANNGTSTTPLQQLLVNNTPLMSLLTACLQGLLEQYSKQSNESADVAGTLSALVEYVGYCAAVKYLLVVLKDGVGRPGIECIQPDYDRLKASVAGDDLIGVIVTAGATAGDGYDVYSRFFAPWAGITEDPVTGSAHAVLAPYWCKVLGKQQMFARQCSERGGEVWMDVGQQAGRVMVSGEAAIVEQRMMDYA